MKHRQWQAASNNSWNDRQDYHQSSSSSSRRQASAPAKDQQCRQAAVGSQHRSQAANGDYGQGHEAASCSNQQGQDAGEGLGPSSSSSRTWHERESTQSRWGDTRRRAKPASQEHFAVPKTSGPIGAGWSPPTSPTPDGTAIRRNPKAPPPTVPPPPEGTAAVGVNRRYPKAPPPKSECAPPRAATGAKNPAGAEPAANSAAPGAWWKHPDQARNIASDAAGPGGSSERAAVETVAWEGSSAASSSRGVGGKGQGKRGRGRGRGNAWGEGLTRRVRVSKTLTQILRHKAPDLGIDIDSAGFCKTEAVLATAWMQELECTLEDVDQVVKESDKQRFEVQYINDIHCIRAVQGHSIEAVDDEASLRRLAEDDSDLPERCVHGTYHRYLDAILEEGLKPGGAEGACSRKHVHFAPFEPGDKRVISGMRYDAEVAIWVDLKRAMQAGIPFYMSPNQVILSPGKDGLVPKTFFHKVVDLKTRDVLHDWTECAQ